MRAIHKLRALWHFWRDPRWEYAADYEVLVRLARRCAYDFGHASSFIPEKSWYMTKAQWEERANFWVRLFAKGNPGKDYRMRSDMDCEEWKAAAEEWKAAAEEAALLLRDKGIDLPPKLKTITSLFIPF